MGGNPLSSHVAFPFAKDVWSISMKLLLIEDDTVIAEQLCRGLGEAGYSVVHANDGELGYKMALGEAFDLGVFDLSLPSKDGLDILHELRQRGNELPVLILSARNTTEDIVRGIRAGGDDYLVKPFSFAELLARLEGLLRRTTRQSGTVLTCGDLSVDVLSHRVIRKGVLLDLQPMEFSLLVYLLRKKNQVVSKTMIMESVWGYHFDPRTNVVESRICRLREKVDQPFGVPLIHTVRGYGYSIKDVGIS